jgi:hypothetical protein
LARLGEIDPRDPSAKSIGTKLNLAKCVAGKIMAGNIKARKVIDYRAQDYIGGARQSAISACRINYSSCQERKIRRTLRLNWGSFGES